MQFHRAAVYANAQLILFIRIRNVRIRSFLSGVHGVQNSSFRRWLHARKDHNNETLAACRPGVAAMPKFYWNY